SWGIPLVNANELPEMYPYKEVAQQGQAHPLSPAYVPDPIELDELVPVYVLDLEHQEYHAPSDDDIQEDTDADSIDYPDEPKDGEEDDDEDPEEDPSEEHEPEDDDDDDDTEDEDVEPTKDKEAQKTIRLEPPMASMIRMRDDIPEEDMPPRRRFVLAASPPGCDVAKSSAAAARAPRVAGRAEDVGYVRALQAFEHRMMTSIEIVNMRVSYQAQAYLSSEAHNKALLARLETLETHMSRMEWQHQRAEDDAVRQIMHTQVLEARARIDMMEDAGSNC
ncbi:hypothetical protein Tco_1455367, partial [Tanacetum coccineum]